MISDQILAVGPFDTGPQLEGPGLEVFARAPAIEEERNRDAVGLSAAEIVVALPYDVGIVHPREGVRVVDRGHTDANEEAAAFLGLGLSRSPERIAPHTAGNATGERGRTAARRGGAQERAPAALALLER